MLQLLTILLFLSGLVGAILLTATATHFGLPISVSHSIIGGYGGAAIAKAGFDALIISGYTKVAIFIFAAPFIGMVMAYFFSIITLWIVRNKQPRKVDKYFPKAATFICCTIQFKPRFKRCTKNNWNNYNITFYKWITWSNILCSFLYDNFKSCRHCTRNTC